MKRNWIMWSTWGPKWFWRDEKDEVVSPMFDSEEQAIDWYLKQ